MVPPSFVEDLRNKVCVMEPQLCGTEFLKCAASISFHGLMGTQRDIKIGCGEKRCGDIRRVKREHLIALLSWMTGTVVLTNIRGDMDFVLSSLHCEELFLKCLRLKKSHTATILRFMRVQLKGLQLHKVTMECPKHILAYDGKGMCESIMMDVSDENLIRLMLKWQQRVCWSRMYVDFGVIQVIWFFKRSMSSDGEVDISVSLPPHALGWNPL